MFFLVERRSRTERESTKRERERKRESRKRERETRLACNFDSPAPPLSPFLYRFFKKNLLPNFSHEELHKWCEKTGIKAGKNGIREHKDRKRGEKKKEKRRKSGKREGRSNPSSLELSQLPIHSLPLHPSFALIALALADLFTDALYLSRSVSPALASLRASFCPHAEAANFSNAPLSASAWARTVFLAARGMSILMSVRARRLKLRALRTASGRSTSACGVGWWRGFGVERERERKREGVKVSEKERDEENENRARRSKQSSALQTSVAAGCSVPRFRLPSRSS